jgi:hypothetical protein
VLVVVQALSDGHRAGSPVSSWPEGFFDTTFGSLADDPLTRAPELNPETREILP